MNSLRRLTVLLLITTGASAQQPGVSLNNSPAPAEVTTYSSNSTVAEAVLRARKLVASNPQDAGAYSALGFALCKQGADREDAKLYNDADEALNRALQISPDNFEAKKARVCVQLGRHEFASAREQAMTLNKRIPDDVMVYGLLVDANAALGNYQEAENAAQWMLNLRPGNTPAFLHAADLREVFGEEDGALQLLKIVLDETSPADARGRADVLTRMAHVYLEIGDLGSAESMGEGALSLQSDNFRTLRVMAQIRQLQGKPDEAVQLLRKSYKLVPRAETMFALAEAMQQAGVSEANEAFADFEQQAVNESSRPDNANLQLIFYYCDHANSPAKALQIAEEEMSRRVDVHIRDAYAWALFANGRYAEAEKQMDILLKVGVREACIFYHAGEIVLRLGKTPKARQYFSSAAELKSTRSQDARIALESLQVTSKTNEN